MFFKMHKWIFALLIGFAIQAYSESAKQEIKAVKATKAPVLDGKLDDNCWNNVPEISDFTISNSDKTAERKTFVKIVYTETAIFFGVKAMVPSDKLVANETPRDKGVYNSDCIEIMLDPNGTGDSFYHFIVNAANCVFDRSCEQGGFVGNAEWDSDMKTAVCRDKDFWSCEIMIPFYSLELSSIQKDNWGINICRESYNPGQELSSVAEKGLFCVGSSFRRLCKLDVDFSVYCWNIEIPKFQSAIKDGKFLLSFSGAVSNKTGTDRKTKIDCALFGPDDKMYSRESREIFKDSDKRDLEYGSFLVDAQGNYTCQIEVDAADNGRILSRKKFSIPVHYVPMFIDLEEPWYRDAIFATQKLENVRFTVGINLAADKLDDMVLDAGIRLAGNGDALQVKKISDVKKNNQFVFDVAGLPDGRLEIFAELKKKGVKTESVITHPLLKLPYKKGEVWRGKDLNWYVDGRKIFIMAVWGGAKEDFYNGYNMSLNWKYPGAMIIGTSATFSIPAEINAAVKENKVAASTLEFYRERVRRDKDNPDLFGHYLVDEPDCHGMTANALNAIYQAMRDEDPYHPVINSTGGAGAVKYPDCAEINGFHCYPKVSLTRTMNDFRKIVVMMDQISGFFKNRKGQQTVAYLHQGFNYGDWDDSSTRIPNYEEYRNQDLMALILGSRGLLHYNRMEKHYPELYIGLPHLVREQALVGNEAIIAPDAANQAKCDKPEMRLLTKDNNGDIWILACNAFDSAGEFTISVPGLEGKTLQVLSEDRSVKVSNGGFSDKFSHYEVHIYTSSGKDYGLASVSKIVAEIDAANKARHKPGNIAFQKYEGEHVTLSCSSSKGAQRRADNGLWHLTDGVFPKDNPYNVMAWIDNTDNKSPDWVEMKLSEPAEIGRVVVYPQDKSLKDYKVEVWNNNEWVTVDEVKDKKDDVIEHKFTPVKTDRIRIFITATNGPNAKIMEVELYNK